MHQALPGPGSLQRSLEPPVAKQRMDSEGETKDGERGSYVTPRTRAAVGPFFLGAWLHRLIIQGAGCQHFVAPVPLAPNQNHISKSTRWRHWSKSRPRPRDRPVARIMLVGGGCSPDTDALNCHPLLRWGSGGITPGKNEIVCILARYCSVSLAASS